MGRKIEMMTVMVVIAFVVSILSTPPDPISNLLYLTISLFSSGAVVLLFFRKEWTSEVIMNTRRWVILWVSLSVAAAATSVVVTAFLIHHSKASQEGTLWQNPQPLDFPTGG